MFHVDTRTPISPCLVIQQGILKWVSLALVKKKPVESGVDFVCGWVMLSDTQPVLFHSALSLAPISIDLTFCLSDAALSNASPGKNTQNKLRASAFSLCPELSLPSHGNIPFQIEHKLFIAPPVPFPVHSVCLVQCWVH